MTPSLRLSARSLLTGAALMAPVAQAQVTVADPWVRATVPQQKATGLFVKITAEQGGRLVGASSPVAGVVEVHEMAMDNWSLRARTASARTSK